MSGLWGWRLRVVVFCCAALAACTGKHRDFWSDASIDGGSDPGVGVGGRGSLGSEGEVVCQGRFSRSARPPVFRTPVKTTEPACPMAPASA